MSKIDLHIHTEYSDGSDGLIELLEKIKKEGITYFSVTDHDEIEGATKTFSLVPKGVNYVNGVEFSCIFNGFKCHILGYGYNPNGSDIKELVSMGKSIRREKLISRLAFLKEHFGIEFNSCELDYLQGLSSAGKPHLAKLLTKKGLCADIQEGISKYLSSFPKCNDRLPASEVVKGILNSGGIPIWAHPLGGEGEKRLSFDEVETKLKDLISYGIKGVECYYSRYNIEEVEFLKSTAKKHGLFISGGSDYHGSNKTVKLGELNSYGVEIEGKNVDIINNFVKKT